MDPLKSDLKQHNARSLALLAALSLTATVLLGKALAVVVYGGTRSLLTLTLLALLLAITSARYLIRFPGTRTIVSVSEVLTFFAVMSLGPYPAALLAAFDSLVICHRLKIRPSLRVFNVSNQSISILTAGKIFYAVENYVTNHQLVIGSGQSVMIFALPLFALASAHYLLHISVVALMSRLTRGTKMWETVRDTFTLETATFVAGATVAGVVNYAAIHYGAVTTAMVMVLVIPVPVIIYYTFKTYQEKLKEQHMHYQEVNDINDSILQMLAMAIDAKDQTTHEHIQRVRLFASRMGRIVGLSDAEIDALKAGALLHDIGKIGVPAYILNKPGKLTEHEFEQMKMHTIIGADMLSNINFRYPVVPIVRHHHERWDGKGYPDGLTAEEIPITARILTLVDNYDALRSDRPYHRAMTRDETLEYIRLNAGSFFDPNLVGIFLSVVDELEAEATGLQSSESEAPASMDGWPVAASEAAAQGLRSAKPAAGFANPLSVNRATAALNSIAETNQRVAALYEMSRTLASSLSLEDTVAILANRLSKMVPFTTCAISLFDASRSEFEYVHSLGRDADKFMRRRLPVTAGITGWVIQHQRPMYNTNPVLDLAFLDHEASMEYRTAMVFPLVKNRESLGAIALYSTEIENYPSEYVLIMEAVTQPASDSVFNALSFEKAQRALLSDTVTGLANMRAFTAQFERELARSRRLDAPLSLAVVRADNLAVAAVRGGFTSEEILTALAELIKRSVRETDLVARHSANSFIALLPESSLAETAEVLCRIGQTISQTDYAGVLALSMGSATHPDHGDSLADLLQAASVNCSAGHERFSSVAAPDFKDSFLH